jgi:hypothetical protein
MLINNFNPISGEFISTSEADPSPLEPGKYLFPSFSTDVAVPAVGAHQVAVFNGNSWDIKADYRGLYYYPDGSPLVITDIGVVVPANALPLPPNITPTRQQQMSEKLNAISDERNRRWRGGFPVEIAGVKKWFPSDEFSLVQYLGLKDKARDLIAGGGVMTDAVTVAGQPVSWSTMDSSFIPITAQIAFDLVVASGGQQSAIFLAGETHKELLAKSADPSSYNYLVNWPLIYGE